MIDLKITMARRDLELLADAVERHEAFEVQIYCQETGQLLGTTRCTS